MPPVFSTIRPTTINGKAQIMTLEQSIDLAEMQADMAFEAYLAAFDEDAHPRALPSWVIVGARGRGVSAYAVIWSA